VRHVWWPGALGIFTPILETNRLFSLDLFPSQTRTQGQSALPANDGPIEQTETEFSAILRSISRMKIHPWLLQRQQPKPTSPGCPLLRRPTGTTARIREEFIEGVDDVLDIPRPRAISLFGPNVAEHRM